MQLDLVPSRIVEERLAAGADRRGVRDVQASLPELTHDLVEVVDQDGEVLPLPPRYFALDEVHLLATRVEPRATELEVGAVVTRGQAEYLGIEGDGSRHVVDIDRDMMNGDWLHRASLRTVRPACPAGSTQGGLHP